MALLPEIHIDVGTLAFERIYQYFLPLIPGWVLTGGLIFAYPRTAYSVANALGLGRYSRVAVLIVTVYVIGLTLYGFSAAVTAQCTIWLNQLAFKVSIKLKRPISRTNLVFSKSWVWRTVAAEFLGPALTPLPENPALPIHNGFDGSWQDLYNVLQDYVMRGNPPLSGEILLTFTYLQAAGWALMYLYWRTPLRAHWSALVVSLVIAVFCATFPFGVNFFYAKFDRLSAWDYTARLIAEIKSRK
jgi:hypothetical protein